MPSIAIDELVKKTGSIYKLVRIAAQRAVELNDGAQKLVECPHGEKVTTTALREIVAGKISLKVKKAE